MRGYVEFLESSGRDNNDPGNMEAFAESWRDKADRLREEAKYRVPKEEPKEPQQ